MWDNIQKYKKIVTHAIPSLMAISIVELVNVEVYLHGPVSKGIFMLLLWLTLQMIPGFVFGYISDRHFRRKMLIISQVLGLIGGIVLSIFGFEIWVLVLIALTFNPMPVARAALLDNYPQYSELRIIAVTFLAQYIPWAFFGYLSQFSYKVVIVWILGLLLINTLLTIFWFQDNYDANKVNRTSHDKLQLLKKNKAVIYTLIAFILSEMTFYLLWVFIEYDPLQHSWLSMMTYGTLIGIFLAMLYSRFPHMSIITLFYSIGAAITVTTLLRCSILNTLCVNKFLNSMSNYDIIGGLYLPFVTVAVIDMLGPKNKALGSATIELGDTIASFLGPIVGIIVSDKAANIFIIITILYIFASLFQKYAERVKNISKSI